MTIIISQQVIPTFSLEAKLTCSLFKHQLIHLQGIFVFIDIILHYLLTTSAGIDNLYEFEGLFQIIICCRCEGWVILSTDLHKSLSLHQHDIRKTVYNPVLIVVSICSAFGTGSGLLGCISILSYKLTNMV